MSLTERGESFYNPQLPGTLKELQEAGIVEDSDGAQVRHVAVWRAQRTT